MVKNKLCANTSWRGSQFHHCNSTHISLQFLWLLSLLLLSSFPLATSHQECSDPSPINGALPVTSLECQPLALDNNDQIYCCPDYTCCTLEQISQLGQECVGGACPGDFECCDGFCCTALEFRSLLDKCDRSDSLCDSSKFTRLRCCPNQGNVGDGVCCTPEQEIHYGQICSTQDSCSVSDMECIDGSCSFNISFDEDSVALFIILVIAAIAVIIVVSAQIACCIFYKKRKKRREKEKSAFKSPEVRRLSATPKDPNEPRVVVQIPTMQNRHSTPKDPQGSANTGSNVSPEFMPVVRYYEKEPRSGRASHNSEPDELNSRSRPSDLQNHKLRSDHEAFDDVQNRRPRSQDPNKTASSPREDFDQEPRRRFPSENSLQRQNGPDERTNSMQNPRYSDYRGSADNFVPQTGRENKGYQNSSTNLDRGMYQRNSHQVPHHPKYQSNQSFDQSFPLPPPRNESRSSSLLRNSQSSLYNSDEKVRNQDPALRNAQLSFNAPQPPVRHSQPDLRSNQKELRNTGSLRPRDDHQGFRQSQPNLPNKHPGLRNSQPVLQNERLPLRNSNVPLLHHNSNARMSSDGFDPNSIPLNNYNRNYVVEEDENDTLVIGAGMSHQSLESSRDSVAGKGQRKGFYPAGEERNLDDPETPLSLSGRVRVETEIN